MGVGGLANEPSDGAHEPKGVHPLASAASLVGWYQRGGGWKMLIGWRRSVQSNAPIVLRRVRR